MEDAAAVEPGRELVEVGLEMVAAETMINAQGPAFEVGEHVAGPRQDDVGGHFAHEMRIVVEQGRAGIGSPPSYRQVELGAVHHRPGGDRGLFAVARAVPGEWTGRKPPELGPAARRIFESVRPTRRGRMVDTGGFLRGSGAETPAANGKSRSWTTPPVHAVLLCSAPANRFCYHILDYRIQEDKPPTHIYGDAIGLIWELNMA